MPNAFRGMMPLMPTAITHAGDLDETSQRRVIDYCLASGAVAIGHFGFASEFHKIGEQSRRRLIELIVAHVAGRVPVFIGVTAPATRIIIDYARQAEDLGADMLMVSLPYVDRPDADGAAALFAQLGQAVTTPIIIQDTPATSAIFTPEFIARVVHEIGQIRAVKAEGADFLTKTVRLMALLDDAVQVIGGAGGKHLIHLLRMGVTAFMTGTEALDIHNAVVQTYLVGDEEGAARLYFRRLLPYFMFYDDHSEELLKKMLHRRGVLECPAVIDPPKAPPMSEVEWRELEWVLERIAYGRDVPAGF
ncbi:MAG TPA: dihydrodipicolinate synthase family protein [Candidatus Hydrogenedentes bacterium]|nr:dihydrodipicolinate synthase family protein [Candidatus Hydrogenedentota bacterium]